MKNLCKLALCLMLLAGVTLVGWAAPARADGAGYTVEFTRNGLEYVLPGDTSVAMSEILSTLGLTGEVTAVEISDTSLFSASNETGVWIVTAHKAFSTTEWMKVTIGGVAYEITVTDEQESVSYLDASGAAQACATYTILSADSSITWGSGWYVAEAGTLTIGSRVTVSGDVHLILCDNAALTVTGGINVAGNNSLTIYAQSTGSDKGALTVSGVASKNAGIGGSNAESGGTITVNGGNITVTGGQYCAGIGGSYYMSHGGAGGIGVVAADGLDDVTVAADSFPADGVFVNGPEKVLGVAYHRQHFQNDHILGAPGDGGVEPGIRLQMGNAAVDQGFYGLGFLLYHGKVLVRGALGSQGGGPGLQLQTDLQQVVGQLQPVVIESKAEGVFYFAGMAGDEGALSSFDGENVPCHQDLDSFPDGPPADAKLAAQFEFVGQAVAALQLP